MEKRESFVSVLQKVRSMSDVQLQDLLKRFIEASCLVLLNVNIDCSVGQTVWLVLLRYDDFTICAIPLPHSLGM